MKWVKTIITIILLVLVCVAIYYGGLLGPIMTSGETYEKNFKSTNYCNVDIEFVCM